MIFETFVPTRVVFGRGVISKLGEESRKYGKRALIITMKNLVDIGLVEKAKLPLRNDGVPFSVCDRVLQEPTSDSIDSLREELTSQSPDVIIGFGGGSCLDSAKACAILATNPGNIWDYIDLRNRPARPFTNPPLPIISIPTTAGTGSEVNHMSVLTNMQTKQKATIKSALIFPKSAIVDPELTFGLPEKITAMTGVDALAHAIECFVNVVRRTPFSDLLCKDAMKRIYDNLPRVVKNARDVKGREQLAWGSLLAGLALAHSSPTAPHALAQPATAHLGLAHGLAVAIFTAPVMRHTFTHDTERFSMIADTIVPEQSFGKSVQEKARLAVDSIDSLLNSVGMYQKLSQNGATSEIIPKIVEDAVTYMNRGFQMHPVNFNRDQIAQIVNDAF